MSKKKLIFSLLRMAGVIVALIGIMFLISPFDLKINHYEQEVLTWQNEFEDTLRSERGYLAIAALFELSDGVFKFGSGPDCEFQITSRADNPIPHQLGRFTHVAGRTAFQGTKDLGVTDYFGEPISGIPVLKVESTDSPGSTYRWGSLTWTLIRRGVAARSAENAILPADMLDSLGERFYIRVWDSQNPALESVESPTFFPVDEDWRLEGEYRVFDDSQTLYQRNVLGLIEESKSTGVVVFQKDGVEYALDATDEGDNLFIVFGDETNGKETYGAGRFLDVAKPTEGTAVVVDFNKTRNPWCAYSAFTTCAFPTKNNILPFAIRAGALAPSRSIVPATSDK